MTKEQIAQMIADKDIAHTVAGRMAELVMGGYDYDEVAQQLTDTYAEWLGISQPEYEWEGTDYGFVNELANEHLAQELADETDCEDEYEYEE